MNWREEKQRAENSLKELNNNLRFTKAAHYEIRFNGKGRLWKTLYEVGFVKAEPKIPSVINISEGFKTWREVAIFLSGMRKALKI